jgi:hypothetical protein
MPPAAMATHFDFLVRRLSRLYEALKTLQGVWGGMPGGIVSIVMHALLTDLACDLPLRAVERRER